MMNDPSSQGVAKLAPRHSDFENRIRRIAAKSENVKWTFHARERMRERDISIRVALTVIREGMLTGKIEPGQKPGEWKAKIVRNVKGRRDVGAVVLLMQNDRILVKTVEWEDLR
ncbi:DUF4258 domain-containing protein [Oricola sp.]|uniref:DUF4258 domain-containing protein n=1 Tax=Oricola sp. TaxID=1979950 RepID=UPI003BAC8240